MKDSIELKPILIVSATREKNFNDTRLGSCKSSLKTQAKFECIVNNTEGLPKLYNKYFTKKVQDKHDIVVFVHDDVYIDDLKLRGKLYKSMFVDKYDVVGVAGASECNIKEPALWHLMSSRESYSGSVYHPALTSSREPTNQVIPTVFGPTPKRCLVLDGLFMAFNIRRARECKFKFNTNYSFHHYDIAACLDANEKKMKLGTSLIHVVHDSPGLASLEDPTFTESQEKFLEQYGQ